MLSGNKPFVFVHGFLGLSSDWQPFARPDRDVCVNLWPLARSLGQNKDQSGGQNGDGSGDFALAAQAILECSPESSILVAYSMGARLAMRALLAEPRRFRAAILISGHPGLLTEAARAERVAHDAVWAKRFRADPWPEVTGAWNLQSVFNSSSDVPRAPGDFDREALASALEHWSLGRQRDLRVDLRGLKTPTLFLTGERDAKFTAIATDLSGEAIGTHVALPNAGHRAPWDQSAAFRAAVTEFLSGL